MNMNDDEIQDGAETVEVKFGTKEKLFLKRNAQLCMILHLIVSFVQYKAALEYQIILNITNQSFKSNFLQLFQR